MKAILLVLLFAFALSDWPGDIVAIIECLLSCESVQKLVPAIVEAIKTGDYMSLVAAIIAELPQLEADVTACLSQKL